MPLLSGPRVASEQKRTLKSKHSDRFVLGRKPGYRPSDRHAPEVMRLIEEEGYSQRRAAARLGISKTTVNEIVKRYGEKSENTTLPQV
jgi:DNA invertase Pin-like site-specific DNA recombinase